MTQASWEERASAGEALAVGVGTSEVDAQLLDLLLDPDDTAVTLRTAVALLEQRTAAAVRVVVRASAIADDQHNDYIGDAVAEFRARRLGADDEFLRAALWAIQSDGDAASAQAARELHAWCGWS